MEKLRDRTNISQRFGKIPIIKDILLHTGFFILNFLFGGISFVGGLSPFATGFSAGVTSKYLITSAAGAAVGYVVFFGLFDSLRFISAITLIILIRLILEGRTGTDTTVFSILLASLCSFISSLAVFLAVGGEDTFLIVCFGEALISGAFSCFTKRLFTFRTLKKQKAIFSPADTITLVFFGSIFLLSLERISISGFSPARALAYFTIMLFALCKRESASAIAGICSAVTLGFNNEHPQLMLSYILTGLICTLTGMYGKIPIALSLIASGTIALILKGDSATAMTAISEIVVSGCIFVFTPERLLIKTVAPLIPLHTDILTEAKSKALRFGLKRSAKAVKDISASVGAVSELLQKTDTPSKESVTLAVKEDICKGCAKYEFCWNKCRGLTEKSFEKANELLFRNERIIVEDIPERLSLICRIPDKITESFNKAYYEYLADTVSRQEIFSAKKAAAKQFYSLGGLLEDASENLTDISESDPASGLILLPVFSEAGFSVEAINTYKEKSGKSRLQVYCSHVPVAVDKDRLIESLYEITGKYYLPPVADEYSKEGTILSFCEENRFTPEYYTASHTGAGEIYCGDTCKCFFDGTGYFYTVLSDGMGTGSRAAVDSVMTSSLMSRLMRAGFSPESALEAVNCALLVKSGDETLATLDILKIDLETGDGVFYKAGASYSVIKKGEKTLIVEKSSMPLGILGDSGFEKSEITLSHGDIVFIISDGAAVIPHISFKEMIFKNKSRSAKELAEEVISLAMELSPSGKHDDITVTCIKLTEN